MERIFLVLVIFIALLPLLKAQSRKCQRTGNSIDCSDATVSELIRDINEISEEDSSSHINGLGLSNINFENNEIQRGWLNATSLQFSSMLISDSDVSTMGPGAFSGRPFNSLTYLVLSSIKTGVINKQTFQDTKLQSLSVSCVGNTTFELDPFGGASSTLIQLSLNRCVRSETLPYITGPGTTLTSLIFLSLNNNELRDLRASSFVGATNLYVLYLSGCNISNIEQGTFDNSILGRLDLSANELTTLSNNLFRYVEGGISLWGNKWRCDCDLVWLKNLFLYNPTIFTHRNFYCSTPDGDVWYEDVDFCPESNI